MCQGEGTPERERKRATSLHSKEQGPALRLAYILHYAGGEGKINTAVSSLMHPVLQTAPSQDAPDGCFKLKNRESGQEGLKHGWEINTLTDQRGRGDGTEELGKLKSINHESQRASWV